jgi:hypothetical protein
VGFLARYILALKLFFKIWFDRAAAERHKALAETQALPEPAQPRRVSEQGERGAVRLLAVLQREGRLVDFLMEDVADFDDAQVGAAVRGVHSGCRKALQEFMTLEPVQQGEEGERVTVAEGFDPSAIRLVGEVAGDPPFKGTLAHHGWRATQVTLPELPDSMDAMIVAPAEVEV